MALAAREPPACAHLAGRPPPPCALTPAGTRRAAQVLLQVQHMSAVPKERQYKGLMDVLRRLPKEQGGYSALFRGAQRARVCCACLAACEQRTLQLGQRAAPGAPGALALAPVRRAPGAAPSPSGLVGAAGRCRRRSSTWRCASAGAPQALQTQPPATSHQQQTSASTRTHTHTRTHTLPPAPAPARR
jgi:hypothetical protein